MLCFHPNPGIEKSKYVKKNKNIDYKLITKIFKIGIHLVDNSRESLYSLHLIVIKKASILTLLFLFFISTTGLPFSVEFCNILKKEIKTECPLFTHENESNVLSCPFEMEKAANNSTSTIKDEDCCFPRVYCCWS